LGTVGGDKMKIIKVESCDQCPFGRFCGTNPSEGLIYYCCVKKTYGNNNGPMVLTGEINPECDLEDG
jgi:hypothetical protein